MRIALINPQTETNLIRECYRTHENLALGLIGAYLEQNGYERFIWDLRVHKINEKQVAELIIQYNINLIGLSVNYGTLPSALEIAQIIKLKKADCIIVLGGEHCTYLDEEILRDYTAIDYIIRGEGEYTFLELAERVRNNQILCDVDGISYYDHVNKNILRTPNRKSIKNLDDIPFASREVANYAFKRNIPIEIGILAQRGCPALCSFCNAYKFLSNDDPNIRLRTRSPLNVVNEIETLVPLFENRNLILHFYDATFITRSAKSRQWIHEFCDLLEERKIKIPFDAFIRPDSFNFKEDKDLINRLKNVGLVGTFIGLEAGDNSTLEIYNKGVECNECFNAMVNLKNFEIDGATNGIVCFHQNVTLTEIRNSIVYLKKLGLCTVWHIATKAATLPGINLEKEMELYPRKTVWDVENYYFSDEKVALLYNAIRNLITKYHIPKFEDNIVRELKEALRLKKFYAHNNSDVLDKLSYSLEEDIIKVQTVTHDFFLDMISNIEKNSITELEMLDVSMNLYAHQLTHCLFDFYQKYSNLLPSYEMNDFCIEVGG